MGIGSDATIHGLKGKNTKCCERERLYQVQSVKYVHRAWINSGGGIMDFEPELRKLKPDIFYLNKDGNHPYKQTLCEELGIRYVLDERRTKGSMAQRSTTLQREVNRIPYRIDLAGGWLDQPYVSRLHPGPVLTLSIEPDHTFHYRSGMATSTREKAMELWYNQIPEYKEKEQLAKILFCYDNPPGTREISGSQDALGIVMSGLNRLQYQGDYWPTEIKTVMDKDVLQWLESHIRLFPLSPRLPSYSALGTTRIDVDAARALARAAENCWNAILKRDVLAFGESFKASFEAQIKMFPNMINPGIATVLKRYKDKALGWKLSGAGGGGYIIFIAEDPFHEDCYPFRQKSCGTGL